MTLVLNIVEKTPEQKFSRNLVRIKYIQLIQSDLQTAGATRFSQKMKFLNQAYVMHLVAAWQVFIRELAEYGFRQIEAYEGSGVFRQVARARLDDALKRFNTPSRENIDRLFKECLGVPEISKNWFSEKISRNKATATLANLLAARHEIAHTGLTPKELTYEANFANMEILMHVAELTEHALIEQLNARAAVSK